MTEKPDQRTAEVRRIDQPSEVSGLHVARVTLPRGEYVWHLQVTRPHVRNALDLETMSALGAWADYLTSGDLSHTPFAVVLTGSDGHFIAGGDLKSLTRREGQLHEEASDPQVTPERNVTSESDEDLATTMSELMRNALELLREAPFLFVVAVEGAAIGGGAEVFLAGDLRVMSESAYLYFAQATLGLCTGWGGAARLVEAVGRQRALSILLSGERMDSSLCRQLGLAHRVTSEGDAYSVAMSWLDQLAERPEAVHAIKWLLSGSSALDLHTRERELFPRLWRSEAHWRAVQEHWEARRARIASRDENMKTETKTEETKTEETKTEETKTEETKTEETKTEETKTEETKTEERSFAEDTRISCTRGVFIVLEGIDGAGTTTQAERLVAWLNSQGRRAHMTREPSDGELGVLTRAALRGELKGRDGRPLPPESFALLFAADRADHWYNEVEPALERGIDVISDRYLYSSIAYQGMELDETWVRSLNSRYPAPDLLLFIEVSPRSAKARREGRGGVADRYEVDELQEKIALRYASVLQSANAIWIDGELSIDEVTSACQNALARVLD